jgi:hypothetical protein
MRRTATVSIVLSLILLVGSAEGRTWCIKLDGTGDAPTIQAGIDSAAAGDMVLVFKGTYNENITFRGRNILLSSLEGSSVTTISSAAPGTPVLGAYSHETTALTIRGFSITGASGSGAAPDGVRCIRGSATVQDCIVHGNSDEGLYARECSLKVVRCVVYNNGFGAGADYGTGIAGQQAGYVIVDSCTVYYNNEANIILQETSHASVTHTIVCGSPKRGFQLLTLSSLSCSCNDVWSNGSCPDSNYVGIGDQTGLNSNICLDPLFCFAEGADYTLHANSPCLDAPGCGQIGALGPGCPSNGVEELVGSLPTPMLDQNAPNPFNPITTIRYGLPEEGQVKLTLYDVTGEPIIVLVDRRESAGYHTVVWSGENADGLSVASGIYIYRLEAGDFVATRKMVLLR